MIKEIKCCHKAHLGKMRFLLFLFLYLWGGGVVILFTVITKGIFIQPLHSSLRVVTHSMGGAIINL